MHSYSRGHDTPLIEQPIYDVFRQTAGRYPDRDALIVRHQNARLSYADLAAAVERTARGLAGLGLQPRDRIGVWSTNCAEWVMLQLAAARSGLVLINVNPAYRAYELRYVLEKSGMKALFLWERDHRTDYRAILADTNAAPQHTIYLGGDSWTHMFLNGVDPAPVEPSPQDVANIQYTSGTTGSPKGVLLTHRNLINNGRVIADGMHLTPLDVICCPVPLYHCFGCVIGSMAAFVSGAALLLPNATFDPLATLQSVQEFHATAIYGVPTMFIAQLEHPAFPTVDFSSLRTGVMAGAPCPVKIMQRVIDEMHCPEMTIIYGQTESSPAITMSKLHDTLEHRISTVGLACANTEVKIVNRESGQTVEVGEPGELYTRGYLVMQGYDGDPDATRAAIDADGWLHTGDLAVMRPDEYFHITGRAHDVIIRGGENIYPREVEEFLLTHPAVADAQVFGLPDLKLGEIIAAWVRLRPSNPATAEEIREFCRDKIAHFKIPKVVRIVDEFPMTVTGKTQKYKMRAFEIDHLRLSAAASVQTA